MTEVTIDLEAKYDLTGIPLLSESRMPSRHQPKLIVEGIEVLTQLDRQNVLIGQLKQSNDQLIEALKSPIEATNESN